MKYFGLTDKGKIRNCNQDCFGVSEIKGGIIAVICDGMGGAKAGDIASSLAVKTFLEYLKEKTPKQVKNSAEYKTLLMSACNEANGVVYDYSCFDVKFNGMGTTLVGGIITPAHAYMVNVGDSRAYVLTKKKIIQITEDQSLVAEMLKRGEITEIEAWHHPQKNIITNALGLEDRLSADFFKVDLSKGNRIMLCSDGVTNLLRDEEIFETSKASSDVTTFCKEIMKKSLALNAPDNVSVLAVQV
jgi:serine/threonine protein phosphatase PrpC